MSCGAYDRIPNPKPSDSNPARSTAEQWLRGRPLIFVKDLSNLAEPPFSQFIPDFTANSAQVGLQPICGGWPSFAEKLIVYEAARQCPLTANFAEQNYQ